jgi:methyl-accepting chemotaxis protein
MALKLKAKEASRNLELAEELEAKLEDVNEAIRELNGLIEEHCRTALIPAINEYNSIIEKARDFSEEVADRLEEETAEKSDEWHDSERGQAVQEFINRFRELDLSELDVTEIALEYGHNPPKFEELEPDVEALADLPNEPDKV